MLAVLITAFIVFGLVVAIQMETWPLVAFFGFCLVGGALHSLGGSPPSG